MFRINCYKLVGTNLDPKTWLFTGVLIWASLISIECYSQIEPAKWETILSASVNYSKCKFKWSNYLF